MTSATPINCQIQIQFEGLPHFLSVSECVAVLLCAPKTPDTDHDVEGNEEPTPYAHDDDLPQNSS